MLKLCICTMVKAMGCCLLRRIRLWQILPLLLPGLLLCDGIAEAGNANSDALALFL